MEENRFIITYDPATGGVSSMVNARDRDGMNWVEGAGVFGTVRGGRLLSYEVCTDGAHAVYETDHLTVTVTRALSDGRYRERYVFRNRLAADVFCPRGGVGIYTPFADNYEKAGICMTQKCHTHLWCGQDTSYIRAVKMGASDFGLGLVLTEGSLDTYSIERNLREESNDRGDFILHPMPFHLLPGEEMTLAFEMFWFETDAFYTEVANYPHVLLVDAEYYTVFEGEDIRFSLNRPDVRVTLEGKDVPSVTKDGRTYVTYRPTHRGEHIFSLAFDGCVTKAEFFVQLPFAELVRRRVEFIVEKQQFHDPRSPLDGAYLIYDNQDALPVFDNLDGDLNASRERLVIGLLIAKYLQYRHDDRIYESLMQYYAFVTREFYDEESGAVYDTIGRDPTRKRLYNAPWMSMFVMEMYKLTGDRTYLVKMMRLLRVYYTIGGEKFYPNGLTMQETVLALRDAGMMAEAEELLSLYRVHVDNIVAIGTDYPAHEVRFEQTIVSPGAALTAQMCLLTGDRSLLPSAEGQVRILSRFNGLQPSYKLYDQAIRHWDGYWFGKRKQYGDTFPHTASIHSSDAFLMYGQASGDKAYIRRAYAGMRNNLCLFHEDGSASCTYLYPLTVNGRRCEFYDDYANEQDGALYFMIKYYGLLSKE